MSERWPKVRLGEVLTQNKEYIDAPEATLYPKLSVKLYGRGVVLDTPVHGSTLKMKRHQVARAGQVILSEIWGKKGAIGIVPPEGEGALCTSHFFLFDIRQEQVHPGYLQAIFAANYLQEQLDSQARGTTGYAAVRPVHLLAAQIPLPPLEEQRRIVARIEELAAKVEEARGLRREAMEEAEALISAYASKIVASTARWGTVRDVISKEKGAVRSGPFGSQLLHEEFVTSGVVAIGTRDVLTNRFEFRSGWYVTHEKYQTLQRYRVHPGDVLCTIVGASIGRFCVVPDDIPLAFTTKHVQALTLNPSIADPHFVAYMLNFNRRSRASLFSQVEGSAQPSLNATKILATELPLLPLSEQVKVVADLNSVQEKITSVDARQAQTAAELNALLPSILDRAFKGEL